MTIDDLLKQGIAALNAGQKSEARSLLTQVVEQDERNEMGWLWLSGAVDTDEDRRVCLENVVAINPNNSIAQRGLERFQKSSYGLDSTSDATSRESATVQPIGEARTGIEFQPVREETHEILRQAVAAIRSGEKERGKQLLVEVIEQDEDNEIAWLWMTRCVTDRDVKRECLERVLAINPDNKHAIEGLKRLEVLSKAESSSKRKLTKRQTRLVIGLAAVVMVFACIGIVSIWWAFNGGLLQLGTAAPIAADITEVSSAADATAADPTQVVPTWTPRPTSTDTPVPTATSIPTTPSDTPILGDPQLYVLTLADLPTGFSYVLEETGYVSNADIAEQRDNPEEFLAQLEEWGRINGYGAGYEKLVLGNPYVWTQVIIMQTSDGAHAYYEDIADRDILKGWIPVSMSTLADEAHAVTRTDTDETSDQIQWVLYRITFRKRNVIGVVFTSARLGYAVFDDALNFAQILNSRISDTPPETVVPTFPTSVATRRPVQTPTPIAISVEETKELGPIWNSTRDESFTVQISLHSVRFDSGDEFSKPKQGHTYVIVDVTIKNLGPSAVRSIGPYDFQVLDANGALRDSGWIPDTEDCKMDLVDLGPNGSISGCFGFEVPIEGTLELIYAPYKYEGLKPGRYLSFTIRQ